MRCSRTTRSAIATCNDARARLFCTDQRRTTNDKRRILDTQRLRRPWDGIIISTAT